MPAMPTLDRRTFVAALACCAGGALAGCAGAPDVGASSGTDPATTADVPDTRSSAGGWSTGVHHAVIEVEGYGSISVALNANAAPISVANFAGLVESGFYDGLTFHRVIEGFMIQGGDPAGNGTGGSDQTIKGEFSANGVPNPISHVRGTISMARSQDYDSASSQFFIMQETNTSLDGQYAAFGNVTDGMAVVDAIAEGTPVEDSNGTVAAENQPRIGSIAMVD